MLKLHGFPISNYHNKVKIALLEKGVPFEEVTTRPHQDQAMYAHSPLGKVPYLVTDKGSLSESQEIMDYLEAMYPSPPLAPADPFEAAKMREIIAYIELHIELAARQLYGEVFFKRDRTPDTIREAVAKQLKSSIAAFKGLAKFSPFVCGEDFTMADCSAAVHLPLVGQATMGAYGEDYILAGGIDWKAYIKLLGARPSLAKVNADRKAALAG